MTLINRHNKKRTNKRGNNFFYVIVKKNYPFNNKCCLSNVIYIAKVYTSKNDYKSYIGSTTKKLKARCYEHKDRFPNVGKNKPKNCTQLENHL